MRLYVFSNGDRFSSENFSFWTCASCLRVAASVYLDTGLLTYAYMLIDILLSYSREKKEEFCRRRVFLCGSTYFPTAIGFRQRTFLFGHALRVSALQISVYLDIGSLTYE